MPDPTPASSYVSVGDVGPVPMTGAPAALGAEPGTARLLLGRTLPSGYPVIFETSGLEQLEDLADAVDRARAQVIAGRAHAAGNAVAP